jgi:hypothetical protein
MRSSLRAAFAAPIALLLVGAGLVAAPMPAAFAAQDVTIGFVSATNTVSEATSSAIVDLIITTSDGLPLASSVQVTFAHTGGTAANGVDVNPNIGTVTFSSVVPVNQAMPFLAASIYSDDVVEPNETFQLTMSNVTGATVTQASTTITISNDDVATVTVADVSQPEGNTGTSTMPFTAQVDKAVQGGFTLDYTTANLTATAGSDYVAASGTLTFAGTANESHGLSVTINGDTAVEANETFRLSFPSATSSVAAGGLIITDTAIGTIANDDSTVVTIGDVSVTEGTSGTTLATFTATLTGAVSGGFTVNYGTTNGTANAGSDYVAAIGTLTFAGTDTETETFTVTVNGDTTVEADETFTVSFNTVSNAGVSITDTATATITNDDAAAVTISDVSVTEGNAGTTAMIFTAALDNAVQGGFTVNYATANGTATTADNDYVAATGTLSFTGTAAQTRTFTVTINGDTTVESDEILAVSLNTVSNAGVTITDTAIGTIEDNDAAAVTIANVGQSEGNAGTANLTFSATLSNAVQGGFTVNYATADGAATAADNDYVAATGTLTFAGAASEVQTFTVTINGDTKVEPNEAFFVVMNTSSQPAVDATDTASGIITNDDTGEVTISDVSVAEGNAGTSVLTFTATSSHAVQGGYTVNYATANVTATAGVDYLAATGTLTFAGSAGEPQTFSVTITGDTEVEPNETFQVSLNTVSNANVTITDTAIGTITNDDSASVVIDDVSVAEGDSGTTTMTFTATLLGGAPGTVTVPYLAVGGSAVAGSDFMPTSGTLSFSGAANETLTFTVPVYGDSTVEDDETFRIWLFTASDTTVDTTDTATATITNDDTATITVGNAAAIEGSSMMFTVAIDNAIDGGVYVPWQITAGTADANDVPLTAGGLLFTGSANEIRTIIVPALSDTLVEGDETFTLSLGTAASSDVDTSDTGTGTVIDDDVLTVALAVTSATTPENGGAIGYTVSLSDEFPATSTVTATFTLTGRGANGVDYTTAQLTHTYSVGDTSTVYSRATIDDGLLEGDEDVTITLTGVTVTGTQFLTAVGTTTGTTTIVDNETTTVEIVADQATATEGSSALRTFTVRLGLVNNTAAPIVIAYTTAGTAGSADVAPLAGTVAIPVGADRATIVVAPLADALVEGDETLDITLVSASFSAVTLGATVVASMTILDVAVTAALASTGTELLPVLLLAALLLAAGILLRRRRLAR